MIDLHTHTLFSDGVLIPAELARRAKVAGYRTLAITDHADRSNLEFLLDQLKNVVAPYSSLMGIDIIPGVELTHNPPALIPEIVIQARENGAQLVVLHGETIVEPVERGTNLAGIEGGVDILAHPGLITPQEVQLAAERGVYLEITTRKGHSLTNGHVASLARKYGAQLIINNDAHAPGDLVSEELRKKIALGAGLTVEEYEQAEANSMEIAQRIILQKKSNPALA